MNDDENNSSESGESVPSEPRPSQQQTFLNSSKNDTKNNTNYVLIRRQNQTIEENQPSKTTLVSETSLTNNIFETMRGLSPERDALNRKVSFSTAPIKVAN